MLLQRADQETLCKLSFRPAADNCDGPESEHYQTFGDPNQWHLLPGGKDLQTAGAPGIPIHLH